MGDRTSVTLTVLRLQAEEAKACFGSDKNYAHQVESSDLLLIQWEFEEVNYGELPFLRLLEKAGIAYDSYWSNGDEYGAGCSYCRFTSEGEAVKKDLYDNEDCLSMDVLTALMDQPVHLRRRIVDKIDERTVLPWDHQEEYGKLYRMKQLIT